MKLEEEGILNGADAIAAALYLSRFICIPAGLHAIFPVLHPALFRFPLVEPKVKRVGAVPGSGDLGKTFLRIDTKIPFGQVLPFLANL